MLGMSNATLLRGQVTISHGANIAAGATQDTTAAFTSAVIGDKVLATPAVAPASGILVGASPAVTTAGQVTISVANITTATVAAGTAVVYDVTLVRPTGSI